MKTRRSILLARLALARRRGDRLAIATLETALRYAPLLLR